MGDGYLSPFGWTNNNTVSLNATGVSPIATSARSLNGVAVDITAPNDGEVLRYNAAGVELEYVAGSSVLDRPTEAITIDGLTTEVASQGALTLNPTTETTTAAVIDITGGASLKTDIITESTTNNGVDIETIGMKDGNITIPGTVSHSIETITGAAPQTVSAATTISIIDVAAPAACASFKAADLYTIPAGVEGQIKNVSITETAHASDGVISVVAVNSNSAIPNSYYALSKSEPILQLVHTGGEWVEKTTSINEKSRLIENLDKNGETTDSHGLDICMSADGSILATVGARGTSPFILIYEKTGDSWGTPLKLIPTDIVDPGTADVMEIISSFVYDMKMTSDGTRIILGSMWANASSGEIGVITRTSPGVWATDAVIPGQGGTHYFGSSVCISDDGTRIGVGGYNWSSGKGRMMIYLRSGAGSANYSIEKDVVGVGAILLGRSICCNADFTTVGVGARNSAGGGVVDIYTRPNTVSTTWTDTQALLYDDGDTAAEYIGESCWMNSVGNVIAVGAPLDAGGGSVYIHTLGADGVWADYQKITPGGTSVGTLHQVNISDNGDTLLISNGDGFWLYRWASGSFKLTLKGDCGPSGSLSGDGKYLCAAATTSAGFATMYEVRADDDHAPRGDIIAPNTATHTAIPRFSGTSGNYLQDSAITVSDTGDLYEVASINRTGQITLNGTAGGVIVAANTDLFVDRISETSTLDGVYIESVKIKDGAISDIVSETHFIDTPAVATGALSTSKITDVDMTVEKYYIDPTTELTLADGAEGQKKEIIHTGSGWGLVRCGTGTGSYFFTLTHEYPKLDLTFVDGKWRGQNGGATITPSTVAAVGNGAGSYPAGGCISGDGNILMRPASSLNVLHIFKRDGGVGSPYVEIDTVDLSGDGGITQGPAGFAINHDGSRITACDYGADDTPTANNGKVFLLTSSDLTTWALYDWGGTPGAAYFDNDTGRQLGRCASFNRDGTRYVVVGDGLSTAAGQVRVFDSATPSAAPVFTETAFGPTTLGSSVSMSGDGFWMAIGYADSTNDTPNNQSVLIYNQDGSDNWAYHSDLGTIGVGASVSLNEDGSICAASVYTSGTAGQTEIWHRDGYGIGLVWSLIQTINWGDWATTGANIGAIIAGIQTVQMSADGLVVLGVSQINNEGVFILKRCNLDDQFTLIADNVCPLATTTKVVSADRNCENLYITGTGVGTVYNISNLKHSERSAANLKRKNAMVSRDLYVGNDVIVEGTARITDDITARGIVVSGLIDAQQVGNKIKLSHGEIYLTAVGTATATNNSTWVALESGTFTLSHDDDFDMTTSGRLYCRASQAAHYIIGYSVSMAMNVGNVDMSVGLGKNGVFQAGSDVLNTIGGGGDIQNITNQYVVELDDGDYISMMAKQVAGVSQDATIHTENIGAVRIS